jgi:hypothetical protein
MEKSMVPIIRLAKYSLDCLIQKRDQARHVTAGLILLAGVVSAEPPSDTIEPLHRDEELSKELQRELVAPRRIFGEASMAGEYHGIGRETPWSSPVAGELTPEEERDLVAPQRIFADESYPGEYQGLARDRAGFFSSLGRSFGHEVGNAWRRWKSPSRIREGEITEGELKALAEGRKIPYEPGMTRGRAERLIADYDFAQYSIFYEDTVSSKIGEFVGLLGGGLLDPVTLMTTPIGGAAFRAAAKAASLRELEIRPENHRRQK